MSTKDTHFTREELIIIAENKGIKEPHKMSTGKLLKTFTRHEKKRVSHNIYRRFSELAQKNMIKDKIHQKATYAKQEC